MTHEEMMARLDAIVAEANARAQTGYALGVGGGRRVPVIPESTWQAFNVANQQMRNGKCTKCGAPLAWARPDGCPVFVGTFALADATKTEQEQTKTGTRTIITGLRDGAQPHGCHQIAGTEIGDKYLPRYAKWLRGELKGEPRKGGFRRRRPAGAPHTREVAPGVTNNVPQPRPAAHAAPVPTFNSPPPFVPGQATAANSQIPAHQTADDEMQATGGTVKSTLPKGKTTTHGKHSFLPDRAMRQWWRIQRLVETCVRPFVVKGPPATGKTSYAQQVGEACGALVVQKTMTPEMPATELFGSLQLINGSFEWVDGDLMYAWAESHKRPVIFVFNEIENVSPDCEVALHLGLDDCNVAQYRTAKGDIRKPYAWDGKKGLRVFCTTNNEMTGLSVGVQSRLNIIADADYPSPGLVDSLHTDEAKRLISSDSREYDIRTVLAWDELMRAGEDAREAAQIIFGDEAAQALMDAIQIDGASF